MDKILGWLKKVWNFIKKVAVAIFNFFENLVNWFKSKYQQVIQKRPNVKAVSCKIKDIYESGNYNTVDLGLSKEKGYIVNTFYDETTGEITEDFAEVVEYSSLDEETKARFADKNMLVLT
ncbi:hypothetical protein CAPN004_22700 [Capnocytophaga cynodegmi]|uniref:hypothetical protein n=1 Tax=Capnocytophaga cynodegmi TaxID=28189 RepID=UPI001AD364E2|nr:hypothetical protein [Capnocytophaga cynodegmi]GIM53240.1 hypothetical protein CAPN004_22700 [Capnocytophaga cynodegmi]